MQQVSLVPILLWLLALASACVAIWWGKRPIEREIVVESLLRYLFLFPLGVMSLWAFLGHVFFPAESAASIGWATSPFQYEVGVANLGLGLASLYAAFAGFQARVAAALAAGGFLIGAGIGHVRDVAETGNLAPGNAGPILFTDFLTPIAIGVLLVIAAQKPRPKSPVTLALEAELQVAEKALKDYRSALESSVGSEVPQFLAATSSSCPACAGHPRFACDRPKWWMAGTSPAMTSRLFVGQ